MGHGQLERESKTQGKSKKWKRRKNRVHISWYFKEEV